MTSIGQENRLNWDPRFTALLKGAFPQKQWFWYDHYRFTPLPELIQTFIGVPGNAILDDNRYVTIDGCVAHDCSANLGMLWSDTEQRPALLLFVGINIVAGSSDNASHLWIFSSANLNWTALPKPFLASLHRWILKISANPYNRYNFVLTTFVQPNGEMQDFALSFLHLNALAAKPGANE